jgi:uncharacterized protein YlxW (UPF0749 family)
MTKTRVKKFVLLGNQNPNYVEKSQYQKVIDRTNVLIANVNMLQKQYDELLNKNKKLLKKNKQLKKEKNYTTLCELENDLETWDFTL